MFKRVKQVTGFAIVAVAAACGGSGDTTTAPAGPLATVTVSAVTTTVSLGSTLQLTAIPKDASGNVISGLSATWTSSNTSVATVSSVGVVSGLAVGSVTITATINGIAGTAGLSVAVIVPTQAATVDATTLQTFSPPTVDIVAGGTVTWRFASLTHNVTFDGGVSGTPTSITDATNTSIGRTFTTAGTFTYQCTLHPGMRGTVVVH